MAVNTAQNLILFHVRFFISPKEIHVKILLLLLSIGAVMPLVGCSPANIVATKWDSSLNGAGQIRCEQVDMRHNGEMQKVFSKYDGWKMIYLSEYTTGNRIGTDAAVCFEHAK